MNILINVIKKKEVFNIACIDKTELVLTYSTSKKSLNTQIWNVEILKPKDVGNRYEKNYTWKNVYKPGLKPNNDAERYPVNNVKPYTAQDRLMKYRKIDEQESNKFKQLENRQQYNTNNTRDSAQNTSVLANNSFNTNISQSKNNHSTQPLKILPGNIYTSTQENNTLKNNPNNFNRKPLKKLTEIIETSEDLEKTKKNRTLRCENNATRTRPHDIKKNLWDKRYLLFSKFDQGIMMDHESFYSVCPEILSKHIALRCPGLDVAMDPFCGAGGNVIQLAKRYKHVIAVDIDANKLEFAKRNAEIYGVREKITFIQGDFFEIGETLKKYKPQVIVTSPP
ncbi:trimethylguanosine synthase-like [Daktulosphaira vitifoliae]|uniref:trimethylguanosine synthase-like n=1 Tax=Daktulosphaira vitifoliae TaxID=58002 RepID=UPI0021A9A915|nr:trimethylguanosine synthase-like [Daktulosphaira vitifoliae]